MKHYLYILFLFFSISINAQPIVTTGISEVDSVFSPKLTGSTFIAKRYNGNQYFNENWAESDILLSNGVMVYGKQLKYNGLLDELIWLNPSNYARFKLDKLSISDFWFKNIQDKPIHFKRINPDKTTVQPSYIFVEVVTEGKVSLYIQQRISIVGSENIYENNKLYTIDLIEQRPVYYIKLPSNRYVTMIKVRRNSFLKLFPEQKKTIIKLLNKNHLNFNSESNIIKIIDLINKEIFS